MVLGRHAPRAKARRETGLVRSRKEKGPEGEDGERWGIGEGRLMGARNQMRRALPGAAAATRGPAVVAAERAQGGWSRRGPSMLADRPRTLAGASFPSCDFSPVCGFFPSVSGPGAETPSRPRLQADAGSCLLEVTLLGSQLGTRLPPPCVSPARFSTDSP